MEELKQQAKEELEKVNAEKKAKEEAIKQQEDKAKKLAEKKLNEEEKLKRKALKKQELKEHNLVTNERDIKQKEKSSVKVCSMNTGKIVPNKSPIKIVSSWTDSDCVIVDSDTNDKMEKNGKIDTNKETFANDEPLNLSTGKQVENDTDAASSSGIYFSDSDEFCKAVEMSKENNGVKGDMKEGETATEDNGVEESSDSGGVFFSDDKDFNRLKKIADKQAEAEAERRTDEKVNEIKEEQEHESVNGTDDKDKVNETNKTNQGQKQENKLGKDIDIDIDGDAEMRDTTVTDGAEDKLVATKDVNDNDTDTDNSCGVFFSDSVEFEWMKALEEGKKVKKQRHMVLKVMHQCQCQVLQAVITLVMLRNSKEQRNKQVCKVTMDLCLKRIP